MARTRSICTAAAPYLAETRVPEIIGAVTVLTILAVAAVILRFLARSSTTARYGVDDWLILFALVNPAMLNAITLRTDSNRFGKLVSPPASSSLYFAGSVFFNTGAPALKLSILVFYHRIFPVQKFMVSCIIIGVVVIGWFIASVVSTFLICRPVAYWWDKSIPGGYCINATTIHFTIVSPADILTNLAILALPIPWLWGLQMQKRKKWAVTIIFLLGSFATVGSIVRIPLFHNLNHADVSYTITSAAIWLNVELSIGILSASLPLMRPLMSRALPSQIRSLFSSHRHTGSHRLQDVEGGSSGHKIASKGKHSGSGATHSKGLSDSGIYTGPGQKHAIRSWYTAEAKVTPKGTETGSEEDMIPMGKIQVRHDLDWKQEREARSVSEEVGTPDTLR
ncbi:MAG: hypothetical protein Q9172_000568 [Xanthocarpia lactea]